MAVIDVGKLTEEQTIELFKELIVNIPDGWDDDGLFKILDDHLENNEKIELAGEWIELDQED